MAYILQGISQGFKIGFDYTHLLHPIRRNMSSAHVKPEVVQKYINCEVEGGCLLSTQNSTTNLIASTSAATTNNSRQVSALAVSPLEGVVQCLFSKGVAASTLTAYSSAHKRYLDFCSSFNISPSCPLSESSLCYFVAHLHTQGLKHQTIKCYLSGIRHTQIALSMPDPFNSSSWPKLEHVLKEVKCLQAEANCQSRQRLPITPSILQKMFAVWDASSHSEALMLKATCCMGFFGFLRAAEFTTPSWREYDKGSH